MLHTCYTHMLHTPVTYTCYMYLLHTCLAPQAEASGPVMMAGWLRSAPAVAKAVRRQREPHPVTDPRQQFAVFDLLLRASMAGSLAFMILVAMTQD